MLLSTLTPQTLLSGWRPGQLEKSSSLLLRLPKPAILVLKDFTTILKMRPEHRSAILAQLREVYDGHYSASYGTGNDLNWDGKVGVLAAVTNVIDQFSIYEQMLGERFLKIRLVPAARLATGRKALENASREWGMKMALREAASKFLKSPRRMPKDIEFGARQKDRIVALADLIAMSRTTPHRDPYSKAIDALVDPEMPSRLARQFGLLVRSLASIRGHQRVEETDISTTCRVAFDSLAVLRRSMFQTLHDLDEGSGVGVDDVAEHLRLSEATTRRHLEDARAVPGGLVEKVDGKWCLSEKARELLEIIHSKDPKNT
jgi:hypothetical protein